MNTVNLIGRIGNDIQIRKTQNDKSVCNFNLAVKGRDKTNWIRIVAWNQTAELLEKYTHKGDQIGVNGSIDVREFEKDGEKRTAFEVIADRIYFCSSKKDQDSQSQEQTDVFNSQDLPF